VTDSLNATHRLQNAIDDEDVQLAAEAIRQGADVNALWDDQTLLSAVVQMGNAELVRLLLSAGADPNRKHPDGTTALTWCGNAEIMTLLLDAGASARHELGERMEFFSLQSAAEDGDVERLRLLLDRGDAECLLNRFTAGLDWTPLHHAANGGHLEAAQLLIDAGADPNLFDDDRGFDTAISLAADRGDVEMFKLLLANGADPTLEAWPARSALDVARRHTGNPELLECIEKVLATRCTRISRHVNAPRADVYRALLDPRAIAVWKAPDGMTCRVHVFEAREGGFFRISLTYDEPGGAGKTTGPTDTYRGRFVKLVPDEQVVEVMKFETSKPAMRGVMRVTITLTDAGDGTDVLAVHDRVPPGVSLADNETGWRMALDKLAALVESGCGAPERSDPPDTSPPLRSG
jgi:ankyrin repeat protein